MLAMCQYYKYYKINGEYYYTHLLARPLSSEKLNDLLESVWLGSVTQQGVAPVPHSALSRSEPDTADHFPAL